MNPRLYTYIGILILFTICYWLIYFIAQRSKRNKLIEQTTQEIAESISPSPNLRSEEDKQLEENRQRMYDTICQSVAMAIKQIDDLFLTNAYIPHSQCELVKGQLTELYGHIDPLIKWLPKKSEVKTTASDFVSKYSQMEERRLAHNKEFKEIEKDVNVNYFNTVLEYPLDAAQRDAIVTLEDNCLVVSSAGSGKTSTMCGKVRYLVDKCGVDPKKILLITYTRKAAESLTTRLDIEGLRCCTFHKLALDIIAHFTQQKPAICSDGIFVNVYETLKKDRTFISAVNRYLASYKSLTKDEFEYENAEAYIEDRKKFGIQSPYPDMSGYSVYTRSEEERKICVFLSENGIRYKYEQPYVYDLKDKEHRQYCPDFTIYYTVDGVKKRLYLEHFGVDVEGNVPKWFGDGENGGWEVANEKYKAGIQWKLQTHQSYGTDLIFTTSADFHNQTVYKKLKDELIKRGVKFTPLSDEDKNDILLGKSKFKEKALIEMLSSFIMLMKGRCLTMHDIEDAVLSSGGSLEFDKRTKFIVKNLLIPFYCTYTLLLQNRGEMDFTDAILMATDMCSEKSYADYDYILVDEFQDISLDRYKLLQALRRKNPLTKTFCVGDDWQSIYRFSGSDLQLFTKFDKYFGYTAECNLSTTYRFGNPLLDLSSQFIVRNPNQKKKELRPFNAQCFTDYKFVPYLLEPDTNREGQQYIGVLCSILDSIPEGKSVYLLGRYTMDCEVLYNYFQPKTLGDRLIFKYNGKDYPFLTVHQAKGLESDYAVLLRCSSGNYGFPSTISDDPVLSLVMSKEEDFVFGEERRVFYVALTRPKDRLYIMYDIEHPSSFVTEIEDIAPQKTDNEVHLCPKCKRGHLELIKEGIAKSGSHFKSYVCSNQDFGCDYFNTVYSDVVEDS